AAKRLEVPVDAERDGDAERGERVGHALGEHALALALPQALRVPADVARVEPPLVGVRPRPPAVRRVPATAGRHQRSVTKSTRSPAIHTESIRRVFSMSSRGFAASTTKSASLPGSSEP